MYRRVAGSALAQSGLPASGSCCSRRTRPDKHYRRQDIFDLSHRNLSTSATKLVDADGRANHLRPPKVLGQPADKIRLTISVAKMVYTRHGGAQAFVCRSCLGLGGQPASFSALGLESRWRHSLSEERPAQAARPRCATSCFLPAGSSCRKWAIGWRWSPFPWLVYSTTRSALSTGAVLALFTLPVRAVWRARRRASRSRRQSAGSWWPPTSSEPVSFWRCPFVAQHSMAAVSFLRSSRRVPRSSSIPGSWR